MFSATAIASFLACHHIATLDRAASRGEITKPFFKDPTIDLLRELGLEHEQRYLRELTEKDGLGIVQIDVGSTWEDAAAKTIQALRQGADAVYQATFLDGPWRGRSDFLLRVDRPSALGNWSYEAVETKLARSTKAGAVVQLSFYSELLSRIQSVEPQWMHVVLGGGAALERFPVQRYIAYFRKIKSEFEDACRQEPITYPEPVEHCDVCSWSPICDARWRSDDYLALVAGITRNQRKQLWERKVRTVVSLAGLTIPVTPKIERIGDAALQRSHEQARLQVKGREEGRTVYDLLVPVEANRGLCLLPLPSEQDVFLDLEANPFVLDQGLEYLIGFLTLAPNPDDEPLYEALWSFDRAEERRAFEAFIARMMDRWRRDPSMHIYHYAPYESTAIKRLAGRHGTCIEEVDELLRAGVFVDLYRVVRQGLRASVESYSIKKLETLYDFTRAVPLRDANTALNSFEAALALGRNRAGIRELLDTIKGYNRDDCVSTFRLRAWLEDRRKELETKECRTLPRPTAQSGEAGEELAARLQEIRALMARLVAMLPADEAQWTDEHRGHWLLAQLLEWHRREDKSEWWEYFRLCKLSDDELQEDNTALGGLVYIGEVDRIKRSIVHRYRFPPQDHAMDRALEAHDPKTQEEAGKILEVNERNRTIDIKRGISSPVPHPTALIPYNIVKSTALRDSLLRLAADVADHGLNAHGHFQAAKDLLLRKDPRALKNPIQSLFDEDGQLIGVAKKLVLALPQEASVLPIQGPPGSGKTFSGARMIVELTKHGRRVGMTAASHKVISNLLREVCKAASEAGVSVRGVQKANEEDGLEHAMVVQAKTNEAVLAALTTGTAQVAAGTAWLWGRGDMARSVDVLFVDEAGQMSLANVLAISQAATSVVLLGDPQQLDQPRRGIHPPGAEVSALGHLLHGRPTIRVDQGIFLTETRRLNPDVCAFTSELFYEGRLLPRPENKKQRLNTRGPLDGTGLHFVPVKHFGNQNESQEEVEAVARSVQELLTAGTTWTNKKGETLQLRLQDILIVAPYNAQVSALAQALPAGARVGTVDKFQGQEAPVVFYSMATSTPEDAPRGMEFLYSLNRLNVAISRAQCVAVLVASPALFQVQCKTPRQIELANAFCRYLEMSQLL
jgi:predicted RecB family nuclease